mgnify:CR=1 FL=1
MLDLTLVKVPDKGQVYPFVFEPSEVSANWDSICPFLEASVRVSFNMISLVQLRRLLESGEAVCIGIARDNEPLAIFVAHIVNYSDYRCARVIAAAGTQLKDAMRYFHVMEGWAMSLGATEIEAWCRPAMERMLRRYGFKHRVSIITRRIERSYQ